VTSGSHGQTASQGFIFAHLGVCALLWGSSFLLIKLLNNEVHPLVVAALRAAGAYALLATLLLAMGGSLLPRGREWRDWIVLGSVNGWIPNTLVTYAMQHLDSGPGALIQACGPLITAVLAHVFLPNERLTLVKLIGIITGLFGVALIIGPDAFRGGGTALAALGMGLVACGYATGNIYARLIPSANPLRMAIGQQTSSMIFATVAALLVVGPAGFSGLGPHVGTLAALSVAATGIPIYLFMRLITRAGPTVAAMTGYVVPIVAVIMGVIVLNEALLPRQVIGGLIVFLGVAITTGLAAKLGLTPKGAMR
jgi:drug/metabolite transporter (DMT)-like permease